MNILRSIDVFLQCFLLAGYRARTGRAERSGMPGRTEEATMSADDAEVQGQIRGATYEVERLAREEERQWEEW